MLEKISQFAEQAATNVSRRQFLGRFGRDAMLVAAATGGFLAFPGGARAGRRCTSDAGCPTGKVCRSGHCIDRPLVCDSTTSSPSCNGLSVGDGCIDGDFIGSCLAGKGGNACSCGELKPKRHNES
jgi:hypothetical protein